MPRMVRMMKTDWRELRKDVKFCGMMYYVDSSLPNELYRNIEQCIFTGQVWFLQMVSGKNSMMKGRRRDNCLLILHSSCFSLITRKLSSLALLDDITYSFSRCSGCQLPYPQYCPIFICNSGNEAPRRNAIGALKKNVNHIFNIETWGILILYDLVVLSWSMWTIHMSGIHMRTGYVTHFPSNGILKARAPSSMRNQQWKYFEVRASFSIPQLG